MKNNQGQQANRLLRVTCTNPRDFFAQWLNVTKPLHCLRPKMQEIFVEFLVERYRLLNEVNDENALNRLVLNDYGIKLKVRERCGLKTTQQVTGAIAEMVSSGVCRREPVEGMDNRYTYIMEPRFIPNIKNAKNFGILYSFILDFDEDDE